jgi:CubicO group peptidase (beta-lactamase class C family)
MRERLGPTSADRRTFLKTAASAALVAPATVVAQSPEAAPSRPSRSDETGRREQAMSAGALSRAQLAGNRHAGQPAGRVHVDAIGMKAVGGSDPIRRDTIFRIASMTKPITAAATMILVEECQVRLDEPVDQLLPELANRRVLKRLDGPLDDTVAANRPITVRDLLTFRMGMGLVMASPDAYPILKAMIEQKVDVGPYLSSAPRAGRRGSAAWGRCR